MVDESAVDVGTNAVNLMELDAVKALAALEEETEKIELSRFDEAELKTLQVAALEQMANEFEIRVGRKKNPDHILRSLLLHKKKLEKELVHQNLGLEEARVAATKAINDAVQEFAVRETLGDIIGVLECVSSLVGVVETKHEIIKNEDSFSKSEVKRECSALLDNLKDILVAKSADVKLGAANIGDLFTKKKINWTPDDKNKILVLLSKSTSASKMLIDLKNDGHKHLPTAGLISKWSAYKEKYGWFSEDGETERKRTSSNISKSKLTSEYFDNLVLGRILICLSLGMKTKRQTYKDIGRALQKSDEFQIPNSTSHPHHKRNVAIQKLTFSDGWVSSFKKRHGLVRRVGDAQKMGKLPTLEEISDNQELYQIRVESESILPELRCAAGKFSFLYYFFSNSRFLRLMLDRLQ